MYKTLLDLFSKEKKNSKDVWDLGAITYLQLGKIDELHAIECFKVLMDCSVDSEKEALSFLRNAFLYAVFLDFSYENQESLNKKLKTIVSRYPSSLVKVLTSLITKDHEVFLPLKKTSRGIFVKDWGSYYPTLFDLSTLAELTFFVFIYASQKKDQKLFQEAKENFLWVDHFFDHRNFPFSCLWSESHEVMMSQKLHSICLLYHLLASWDATVNLSKKSQDLLAHMMSVAKKVPDPFFVVVSKWISTVPKPDFLPLEGHQPTQGLIDEETGVGVLSQEDFSLAISYSGIQSSLAEIHCQDIHVVSVGPQHFPLKELSSFGNFRPLFEKDSFSDVALTLTNQGLFSKGWIRLTQSSEKGSYGSKLWLNMTTQTLKDRVLFAFSSLASVKDPSFMISFFIKAKSCLVEQTTLLPSTLDQFSGSPPQKLSFRGKETSLEIVFKQCSLVHIIPLSGEQFFWEANFLLGCEPSFNQRSVEIELKKICS